MKHPCANDLVERLAKLANPFDRKPVKTQISDVVLLFKITGVAQARFAEVDRGHARFGLHERMTRRLRRSAPSHKNRSVWTRLLERPQQQILRSAPVRIAIAIEALLEAVDGRRIWVRLVERANRVEAIGGRFRTLVPCRHPFPPQAQERLAKTEPRRNGGFDTRSDSDYPKSTLTVTVNIGAISAAKMLKASLRTDRIPCSAFVL
jgi:hypothetical protein